LKGGEEISHPRELGYNEKLRKREKVRLLLHRERNDWRGGVFIIDCCAGGQGFREGRFTVIAQRHFGTP